MVEAKSGADTTQRDEINGLGEEDHEMQDEGTVEGGQLAEPLEILVVDQAKFYPQAEQNNQEIRSLSETIFIKAMNNFIKTLLIKEAVGRRRDLSVLDLCCGVGGDLEKWQKVNIAHYVGSDLSDKSVIEAQSRHEQMCKRAYAYETSDRSPSCFSAIFVVADASASGSGSMDNILNKEQKRMKIREKIEFDVVSTQFAIHYMFESETMLRGYLENVSKRLVDGGVFIGTTIDGDRLVHKIREAGPENNLTIGNEIFSIVFGQDSFRRSNGPFGLKYYFYLADAIGKKFTSGPILYVDEYLVPFDTLVTIARDYGLELEKKVNFQEYFDAHITNPSEDMHPGSVRYHTNLFERMVKNRIGHLTQEQIEKQWEVVGLYCVFIFKKVGASNVAAGGSGAAHERESSRSRYESGRDHRDYRSRGRNHESHRRRHRANFGNFKLSRPVIDEENWD